jgi:hypothetical protein
MPHAVRNPDELPEVGGFSPYAGRPLFVPPGIAVVRTGPTTRAELDRLLADESASDLSGVRLRSSPAGAPRGWSRWLALLGFAPAARR